MLREYRENAYEFWNGIHKNAEFDEEDIKYFFKDFEIEYMHEEVMKRYEHEKFLYRVCCRVPE